MLTSPSPSPSGLTVMRQPMLLPCSSRCAFRTTPLVTVNGFALVVGRQGVGGLGRALDLGVGANVLDEPLVGEGGLFEAVPVGYAGDVGREGLACLGRSASAPPSSLSLFEWALTAEQERETELVGAGRQATESREGTPRCGVPSPSCPCVRTFCVSGATASAPGEGRYSSGGSMMNRRSKSLTSRGLLQPSPGLRRGAALAGHQQGEVARGQPAHLRQLGLGQIEQAQQLRYGATDELHPGPRGTAALHILCPVRATSPNRRWQAGDILPVCRKGGRRSCAGGRGRRVATAGPAPQRKVGGGRGSSPSTGLDGGSLAVTGHNTAYCLFY